jgi:hypothetical protein
MLLAAALAFVAEAEARLWSPEGVEALAYLIGSRCLTLQTIGAAHLGWTPGVRLTTKDGRPWTALGWVIPWFDRDRLSLVKIRQPDGVRPKYAEAFRDRPTLYPGPEAVRPGCPLIVPEGEFDRLLLAQELGDLAAVVTMGSASERLDDARRAILRPAAPWYIATDRDAAGEKAAEDWPARARRGRPPGPFNDWTEARQAGVDLRRWWSDRLRGREAPPLFTWPELAGSRWGPAPDPEPGIIIDRPDPARRRRALEALGAGPGDAFEADLDGDGPEGNRTNDGKGVVRNDTTGGSRSWTPRFRPPHRDWSNPWSMPG